MHSWWALYPVSVSYAGTWAQTLLVDDKLQMHFMLPLICRSRLHFQSIRAEKIATPLPGCIIRPNDSGGRNNCSWSTSRDRYVYGRRGNVCVCVCIRTNGHGRLDFSSAQANKERCPCKATRHTQSKSNVCASGPMRSQQRSDRVKTNGIPLLWTIGLYYWALGQMKNANEIVQPQAASRFCGRLIHNEPNSIEIRYNHGGKKNQPLTITSERWWPRNEPEKRIKDKRK